MRLLISVATHNRPHITELCLENLQSVRLNKDIKIVIYDDASTSYDLSYLLRYSDEVIRFEKNGGIERSRARSFRDFVHRFQDYDLLYLTDNDAIHDPIFAQYLIELFINQKQENENWPVGLFNSTFHQHSIVSENEYFYLSNTCPGISQCYDRNMAKRITQYLDNHPLAESSYGWDYDWPRVLQCHFLIPKISYVEHFSRDVGQPGIHSNFSGTTKEAFLEDFKRDCAINPSPYLIQAKDIVINKLF